MSLAGSSTDRADSSWQQLSAWSDRAPRSRGRPGGRIVSVRCLTAASHLLVRDVPQPDLAVQRPGDEELVVLGVEGEGGDTVDVLEDAETLLPRDVPEADRLVHGAGQDEVVLGPGDVQQVRGVAGVRHEGTVHEDVTDGFLAGEVVSRGLGEDEDDEDEDEDEDERMRG